MDNAIQNFVFAVNNQGLISILNMILFKGMSGLKCFLAEYLAELALFLYFLHFFACIIVGAVKKNLYWILSGVLIILIGFSTCIFLLNLKGI